MLKRLILAIAALFLFTAYAFAQLPGAGVQQFGSVTANDCVSWKGNGLIQDAGSTCGGGGGGSPGGATGTIQYNNAGSFGGISQWSSNGTTSLVGSGTSTFSTAGSLTFSGLSAGTQVSCLGLNSSNAVVLNAAACGSGGANPTATAGPNAVNGSATTFMRSDASPAIQLGTSSVAGLVQCDNTTITCTAGVITAVGGTATNISIGTTTLSGGTTNTILYQNGASPTGTVGELSMTGTAGSVVMSNSPSISAPTVTTSFTATGLVTLADLANLTTNTVLGNATSGSAAPTDLALPSCSGATNALKWTTNTGFGCNTIAGGGTVTSAVIAGAGGNATYGTCTITTTGTCNINAPGGFLNVLYNTSLVDAAAGCATLASCTIAATTAATSTASSISGTTLTWGGTTTGTLAIGTILTGTGIAAGTVITAGSGSSWTVSVSQTVSSESMTAWGGGGFCALGVYVIPLGNSVTCGVVIGDYFRLDFPSSVLGVVLRWPVEGVLGVKVAGARCTFGVPMAVSGYASVTPQIEAFVFPNGINAGAVYNVDLAPANMNAVTSTNFANNAYTWNCSNNANIGYSVDVVIPALASGGYLFFGLGGYDFRATPGVTTGINANPPPIEIRDPVADHNLNLRYYNLIGVVAAGGVGTKTYLGCGGMTGTTTAIIPYTFPVPMRVAPTITPSSTTTGLTVSTGSAALASSAISSSNVTTTGAELDVTVSGASTGNDACLYVPASTQTYYLLNAAFIGGWLLRRDIEPWANDNSPAFMDKVG